MMDRWSEPVVVIGAGLSGLCCALHLQERGHDVIVLEGSDEVGGRVRTDRVDGFLLDRGFQVLLTAYPAVREQLDLEALELGSFDPGAVVFTGEGFRRVSDPFRRPGDIWQTLRSGLATPLDGLRIARLRRRLLRSDVDSLLRHRSETTMDALCREGFSDRSIERFFRPFLAGVLLDRELRSSSRAFEYFFRMFAEGSAALPARGMGAIPKQLADRLRPGSLRTHARVAAVDGRGARLTSGEHVSARAVVVATEASVAAKLIPGLSVPDSNPACCLYFDADSAPDVGPFLVLDGARQGPVNELCIPSAVVPSYAPPGRALVSASVLAPASDDDRTLERDVRQQLTSWFGAGVAGWRLLRIDRIPEALARQLPGEFEPRSRTSHVGEGLFVCGDHRDLASIQGAMASGQRAASEVAAALL